ncbi:MAG: hypothetical protein KKH22_13700 [Proteobacteria bacterium]|nr:hypothetical protein [Pseudomonadota bacterium]
MNKSSLLLLALFASLTLTITAQAVDKKTGKTDPQTDLREITFFFSNDVRGETEPCG